MTSLRLGVNIDHVATVRNARGGPHPDPVRAAKLAMASGADCITAHLREDRRHIHDADLAALVRETLPINLEMAATSEMLEIALMARPHACCIVPERREERTTEGGLDAAGAHNRLVPMVKTLKAAGIAVTLFIEADPRQFDAAVSLGVPVVELHTGAYHDAGLARRCGPSRVSSRPAAQGCAGSRPSRSGSSRRSRPDIRPCGRNRRHPRDRGVTNRSFSGG